MEAGLNFDHMFQQLYLGAILILMTVAVHAVFITTAMEMSQRLQAWLRTGRFAPKATLVLIVTTLWIVTAHSLEVWIWGFALIFNDIYDSIEPAIYFTLVAFTTLGFPDEALPQEWRLLSGIVAANGFLLFGVSTAFLVEFLSDLRQTFADRRKVG